VEGPEGSVFIKLTGPDVTAAAMAVDLEALLKTLKKGK